MPRLTGCKGVPPQPVLVATQQATTCLALQESAKWSRARLDSGIANHLAVLQLGAELEQLQRRLHEAHRLVRTVETGVVAAAVPARRHQPLQLPALEATHLLVGCGAFVQTVMPTWSLPLCRQFCHRHMQAALVAGGRNKTIVEQSQDCTGADRQQPGRRQACRRRR